MNTKKGIRKLKKHKLKKESMTISKLIITKIFYGVRYNIRQKFMASGTVFQRTVGHQFLCFSKTQSLLNRKTFS